MKKKTILVVDDEAGINEELSNIFSREGYQVLTAADGERALEEFKKREIDLVLLDIKMPKMDGVLVSHEMREIRPNVPVIIITGSLGNEESDYAVKVGAKCTFHKPFDVEKLIAAVKKYAPLDA